MTSIPAPSSDPSAAVSWFSGLDAVMATIPSPVLLAGTVILACKMITIWTPTKVDDKAFGKAWNILSSVLNLGALNLGKDRNADGQ